MTFGVLCTEIEKLLSECGTQAVLLAVAMEIKHSHPETAEAINILVMNRETQKGE